MQGSGNREPNRANLGEALAVALAITIGYGFLVATRGGIPALPRLVIIALVSTVLCFELWVAFGKARR